MSIKVGFLNNRYEYNSLNKQDDILTLNSFVNSNVIQLNTEANSTNDIFIKFKNIITTGVTSNTYVIDDVATNSRLITANSTDIQINKPLIANKTFTVKNMITASSNNIVLNLGAQSSTGSFILSTAAPAAASNILKISANKTTELSTDDFRILNSNQTKTLMQVTPSQTNINQNVYINDGTLYVNAISPIGNRKLEMYNVTYSQSIIDSFLATKKMSIIQASTEGDVLPFEICKKYGGSANVFHAYSCNIVAGKAPKVYHNLVVNRDGLVGLGTNIPDASLSIRTLNNNIISYAGSTYGEIFKLTKQGDIGIGTTVPRAQVHIRRNDDETNDTIRRNPMLYLDMNYDAAYNYSNLYNPQNSILTDDIKIVSKPVANAYVSGNTFNIELTNNFYMINNPIYSAMGSSAENISNIQLYNSETIEFPVPVSQPGMGSMYFLMTNKLIYPGADAIYIEEDSSLRTQNTFIENNQTIYQANYVFFMMSQTTKLVQGGYNNTNEGYFNASNFTNYLTNAVTNKFNDIVYSVNNYNIRVKIDFVFEKNTFNQFNTAVVSHPITYSVITRSLINPPKFMQVTYNNNFVSSITTEGTLCLGAELPASLKDKNYKVYTPTGGVYAQSLLVSRIDTDDSNISFSGKNLANVNKLICKELDVATLAANNIDFDSVSGTFIDMDAGHFDHIYTSNITFQTLNNGYISMNSNNVLFKNRVHCGSVTSVADAYIKVATDSNIALVSSTANLFNTHLGIVVTNLTTDNINPAISVQTVDTSTCPYFRLNNSETSYYFRVKKTIGSDSTPNTMLQIANDNITDARAAYFVNNNSSPHIMQHIKEYNVLTFGEQNTVCIDTLSRESQALNNTDKSSKISIGVPYGSIAGQYAVKDYPKYFAQHINTDANPYMLNIFGNVAIANIANNPMIAAITNDNKVYVGVNGHPDNVHTLRVFGDIASSNIHLDGLLSISANNTKNLLEFLNDIQQRLIVAEAALKGNV